MSQDKRIAPRVSYPCDLVCQAVGVANPMNPRISDLSVTGAFVDTMNPAPAGTRLTLRFTVAGREIRAEAEVAHAMDRFGMGVRFVELSEADRELIESVVFGSPQA